MMLKKFWYAGRSGTLALVLMVISLSVNANIFVTNDGSWTVTVYANSATGNQAPLREFDVGGQPRGIYVDTRNGEIFVATQGGSIFVYDINAMGTPAALRTITSTGDFQGIHVDTVNNEIFVADRDGFIHVYNRTATGAGAPKRSLTIPNNRSPRGVSVDAGAGELYVSISGDVLTFTRTASGVTAPLRTITSALGDMSQLSLDKANAQLVVANHGRDAIRVWPSTANGAVAPLRSIIGMNTRLDSPRGVAVCATEYFATARNDDLVTVYAASTDGDVAPLRTIEGILTNLNSPRFIDVTCNSNAAIPTLSPMGLLALVTMLGLLGFFGMRYARPRLS